MPTVHAQVDVKTKQAIRMAAKEARVSSSDIVRWALDAYLRIKRDGGAVPRLPEPAKQEVSA